METTIRNRTAETGNAEAGWPFDAADKGRGFVTLTSGVYHEVVPAGRPVSELREQHQVTLDLDPEAKAIVNGREVDDGYCPQPAETVVWTRRAGEKGGGEAR